MALVTQFGYTNNSDQTFSVDIAKIEAKSNYGLITEEPNRCVISNRTTPLGLGEQISYTYQKIPKVSTDQDILYPATVKNGVQYSVRVEEILSTTDTVDPSFRVDEPIVAWLTIRHPLSSRITESVLTEVLSRLTGACYKDDGTTRFGDMMRSSLQPTED